MKEIRTFDEVFKAIKKEENQNKQKRQIALQKKQPLSEEEDEDDDEEKDEYEEDDGIEMIPAKLDDLDDQDIDDNDRQVLNERILGIINVFQNLG